jgi:hypothetical protein
VLRREPAPTPTRRLRQVLCWGLVACWRQEEEALLAPCLTKNDLLRLSEAAPSLKSYRGLLGTIRLLRWHEVHVWPCSRSSDACKSWSSSTLCPWAACWVPCPATRSPRFDAWTSAATSVPVRARGARWRRRWRARALRGLEELRIEPAFTVEGARGVTSALAKGACPSLRVLDLSGRTSPRCARGRMEVEQGLLGRWRWGWPRRWRGGRARSSRC